MQSLLNATIVDISHYNQETVAAFTTATEHNLVAVVHKMSQGLSVHDNAAADNLWNAWRVPLKQLGGYHFGTNLDPVKQADFFLDLMEDEFQGVLDGVEMMLDLEYNRSGTMTTAQAADFILRIEERTKRLPLLYMGKDGPMKNGSGLPNDTLSRCDLVLPKYGPWTGQLPLGFRSATSDTDRGGVVRYWQFTDGAINGGPFPGLGKVDQWHILGFSSVAAWAARWGH